MTITNTVSVIITHQLWQKSNRSEKVRKAKLEKLFTNHVENVQSRFLHEQHYKEDAIFPSIYFSVFSRKFERCLPYILKAVFTPILIYSTDLYGMSEKMLSIC